MGTVSVTVRTIKLLKAIYTRLLPLAGTYSYPNPCSNPYPNSYSNPYPNPYPSP